ncbi:MAG: hypothetical protein ACI9D8_000653, partial [Reinekea sp.]
GAVDKALLRQCRPEKRTKHSTMGSHSSIKLIWVGCDFGRKNRHIQRKAHWTDIIADWFFFVFMEPGIKTAPLLLFLGRRLLFLHPPYYCFCWRVASIRSEYDIAFCVPYY